MTDRADGVQVDLFTGKPSRGRPRKNAAVRMYFAGYLHPGEDDDLIEWYESLPQGKRFATLVALLRSGGAISQAVLADRSAGEDAADELISKLVS